MNGNPFIPTVEPYNATKDILNAYMMDYNMKLERQSQVMNLMQQLNPVQLMRDEFRIQQYDGIKGLEDYVTGLMKQRKGRITSEDLFNIQYKISNFERYQDDIQMKDKILSGEMELAQKSDDYIVDPAKLTKFVTSKGEWFPTADENGLRFVKEVFPNWEELVSGQNPFDEKFGITDITEYDPVTGIGRAVGKTRYGANDEYLPSGERNLNGEWANRRKAFMSYNLINNKKWKGSAKEAYALQPQSVRDYYDEIWMKDKTSPSEKKKLADGSYLADKIGGWYYWAMDQYGKIQPTTTDVEQHKYGRVPGGGDDSKLPEPSVEVLTGDQAVYDTRMGVKKSPSKSASMLIKGDVIQSLPSLKTSKNLPLTDDTEIINYTMGLFPDEATKSYLDFALNVGKAGDVHPVSKEGNKIIYGVPIYSGTETFTTPKIKVIVNGKEENKKFVLKPGMHVPQQVLDAMNTKNLGWESNNVQREDRALIVYDFGSKSMTTLRPITDDLRETFGEFEYQQGGVPQEESLIDKTFTIKGKTYSYDDLVNAGWTVDQIKQAHKAGKI